MTKAVIFDMDGLLLDSEIYWEKARKAYCGSLGCDWSNKDELAVKGNNSPEWAEKIKSRCHLDTSQDEIIEKVEARMRALYEERLPLLPGAIETVQSVASTYPTGLASSSPPGLLTFAMTEAGLLSCFSAIISADTVGRGKPAPDVFLVAASKLGVSPHDITVFEDSSAGITAGKAAGMYVIAVPNPHFPPSVEALGLADRVLTSLLAFTMDMLAGTPSITERPPA